MRIDKAVLLVSPIEGPLRIMDLGKRENPFESKKHNKDQKKNQGEEKKSETNLPNHRPISIIGYSTSRYGVLHIVTQNDTINFSTGEVSVLPGGILNRKV